MITPNASVGRPTGLSSESATECAPAPRVVAAPIICLDGGAGTGKSTIATLLADKLGGLSVVDTGLWFRGLAVLAERYGINIHDETRVAEIVRHVSIIPPTGGNDDLMRVVYDDGSRRSEFYLRTKDLGPDEVGDRASILGRQPAVRKCLLDAQRALATERGCVTTGRAQGTEVFGQEFETASNRPVLRVLLWAAPEVRAERRFRQNRQQHPAVGVVDRMVTLEDTLEFIKKRDLRDTTRDIAPLLTKEKAIEAGYVVVDTGQKSQAETVEAIVAALNARLLA